MDNDYVSIPASLLEWQNSHWTLSVFKHRSSRFSALGLRCLGGRAV